MDLLWGRSVGIQTNVRQIYGTTKPELRLKLAAITDSSITETQTYIYIIAVRE